MEAVKETLSWTEIAPEVLSSAPELRKYLSYIYDVHIEDNKEVYIVDASKLDPLRFNFFLTPLEYQADVAFWFYGRSLYSYPKTIASRCSVKKASDTGAVVSDFMEAVKKFGDFNVVPTYALYLIHRGPDMASKMLSAISRFNDFMFHLDAMQMDGFNTVITFTREFGSEHVALFEEWMIQNPIFPKNVLALCPFLRGMGIDTTMFPAFFFPSLVAKKFGMFS